MNTSYDAWARFDVEQELERVDLREQREEQERQVRKQAQAKRGVEDAVAQSSEDAAEVLAAQAAVAALKAKQKGRRRSRGAKGAGDLRLETAKGDVSASIEASQVPETNEDDAEAAERLKRKAQLMKRKHELLQQIVTARRGGEATLEAGEDRKALTEFEAALEATRALEAMLPEISQEQGREKRDTSDEKSREGVHDSENPSHDEHGHHHDGGGCEHKCKHNQHGSDSAPPAALPLPSDLKAVVGMFYKDIYLGIGTCQMHARRYSLASEAFKEVLVRDASHAQAWKLRDAPLLAMLHYNRVTTLAPGDEEGAKIHEEIKRKLLDDEPAASDTQQSEQPATPGKAIAMIAETFQQGSVIMIEGFFEYAAKKFKAVLRMLDEHFKNAESPNSLTATVNPEVLRQLEIAANMNIASANLEMQREYGRALAHCERVLELDPERAACHFRMGQLLRASHKYDKAIVHLEHAQRLCRKSGNPAQFANAIAKEMDKAVFDRGQYDYAFVKAAASREKHQSS